MPSGARLVRPATHGREGRPDPPAPRVQSAAPFATGRPVLRKEEQKGFAVPPRRWVIERAFGCIARCRRMARDYEATPSSALAFFVLAAATILVRRIAKAL